tara:strand:- start:37 stop:276 length:240 start_codon:yes stop_codon:yes gene_type:complete
MNDFEIKKMKDQLDRLDSIIRILAAKECSCMACVLSGCDCCENPKDADKLIAAYEEANKLNKDELKDIKRKENLLNEEN